MNLKAIADDLRATGLEWAEEAANTIERELAEQTYEYGIEVEINGNRLFVDFEGAVTTNPWEAYWTDDHDKARKFMEWWNESDPARVVRRTVGEIEVVE